MRNTLLLTITLMALTGCHATRSSVPPASLVSADRSVRERMSLRPTAQMPVDLAVARVQATYSFQPDGTWNVVDHRDIETASTLARIEALPGVQNVAMLNRLLVPGPMRSDEQLREAAASVRADLLLAYTVATEHNIDNHQLGLLEFLSLGLLPVRTVDATATASAVLFDVRSGYVYGLAEATASDTELASIYTQKMAIDEAYSDAARDALEGLVNRFVDGWPTYLGNAGLDVPTQPAATVLSSQ